MPDAPSPGASLTVLGGPLKGKTLLLEDAVDEILVGSDPDSRFCLDVPGVSPIHARIWLDLAGAKVYDTRSPRGVYINDSRVQGEAVLHDGDILWLGPPGEEESVMIRYRGPSDLEGVQPMPAADATLSAEAQPILFTGGEPAPEAGSASSLAIGDDELAFAESPPVPPRAPSPPAPSESEPLAGLLDDFAFLEEPTAVPPVPSPVPPPAPAPRPPAVEEFAPASLPDEFLVETPGAPAEASWAPAAGEPALAEDAAFFVDEPDAPAPPPVPPPLPVTPPPIPRAAPAPPPAAAKPAAPPAAKADAAPPARRPDRPVPAVERPAAPPSPRVRPERPAPAQRPGRPAAASPIGRYAAIGAGVLVLLAIAGFFLMRGMGAPSIDSIAPSRARAGEMLTVTGKNFSPTPSSNLVRFEGSRDGRVVSATPTQLQVEVPDVPAAIGRPNRVPVTVTVGGHTSDASLIAVYQAPRIHGLSPSVAMPGEDVVLAGSGWGQGAAVRFGNVDVPVVEVTSSTIKVRVPQIAGPPGSSVPVVVSMGADPSNPAPFILGRLPLILSLEPRTAGAGDTVTIRGRGFTRDPARDVVRVAGMRAVVGTSSEEEIKFVVPFLDAPAGDVPVELRIAGLDNVGQSTLTLAAPADPVDLRFSAEPFEDEAGHLHAVISTALGPAFVLSAAAGHSALERAFEAQRRLNDAAAALKASREADIEVRAADGAYGLF
ncbi:MAG TPA: IPT/TIG domain-containing protein, partial [Candidatus Polarisedimenticolia bacterium]|nr:IPT/TIG domain-containing protein [Candidatus Polarisedimenticolia bacterium]